MALISPGDVPWDSCPHRARFEDKARHMEQITDKMIEAVHTELDAATRDIKQEIRHQGELSAAQMVRVEAQFQQISTSVQSLERRVERLETAKGKAAVAAWIWLGGSAGAVVITYLVTRLLGG